MENKTITVWERSNKQDDGSFGWEHNHISDGYSEDQAEPTPMNDYQKKSWKGAKWRSLKAEIVNSKVEMSN